MEPISRRNAAERSPKSKGDREVRDGKDSAIRQLRRRLKMLRDYQADTLSQRAGDVELAVETVIFEQLMIQSKQPAPSTEAGGDESLHAVLENVQKAVQQLADQRESTRIEHERLMEQHAKLEALTVNLATIQEAAIRLESIPASPIEQASVVDRPTIDLEEYESVVGQLTQLRAEHEDLLDHLERQAAAEAQADNPPDLGLETEEYHVLRSQLKELTNELTKAREDSVLQEFVELSGTSEVPADVNGLIITLRQQLLHERQTVVELRLEIDDLRVKQRALESNVIPQEAMSWDEQKARLLRKLEGESTQDVTDPNKPLEIRAVIEQTDREIARRDAEIAELKRLLAEQSTASQSVAIGAAAVAELLNQDDFIVEERENLRALQEQWRIKLREAEVEISMERAKIARQRSELEEYLKEVEINQHKQAPTTKSLPGSRWLSRLGLSEPPAAT